MATGMARERLFRFKRFSVAHEKAAMKVGTDGVLLGAWCDVDSAVKVLDVGTGCGLIALMVAQRNPVCEILGIDIDADAIEEANLNFSNSLWSDRLEARWADFNDFAHRSLGQYDLIVSNPPFFTQGSLPPVAQRKNARHTLSLSFGQLLSNAKRLLSPGGMIALITPIDAIQEIVELCVDNALNIKRKTEVVSIDGLPPKRVLWELSPSPCVLVRSQLVIENPTSGYTLAYRALCRDFYLKF